MTVAAKPRKRGFATAFGIAFSTALGLEALAIAGLLVWFASRAPTPPLVVVPLQIESAAPAPDKPQPKVEPPKPQIQPPVQPQVQPQVQPTVVQPVLPRIQPKPTIAPPTATPAPTASPIAEPAAAAAPAPSPAPQAAATPPAPPPVVAEAQADMPAYNAKLTAAAQAAFSLPQVAIDLNFRGRARVGFTMRDAVPSAITVVQSSGLGVVDRAAVKAVQAAQYPAPPVALRGKDIAYLIWVSAY